MNRIVTEVSAEQIQISHSVVISAAGPDRTGPDRTGPWRSAPIQPRAGTRLPGPPFPVGPRRAGRRWRRCCVRRGGLLSEKEPPLSDHLAAASSPQISLPGDGRVRTGRPSPSRMSRKHGRCGSSVNRGIHFHSFFFKSYR